MLLHDITMTSYWCQRYAVRLVTTLCSNRVRGQCTGTPRRARATVELLRQETPNVFGPNLQIAQISVLWTELSCSIASTTDKSIEWMNWNGGSSMSGAVLNNRLLTRLLTSGEEDIERVSMLKEDISSTACEPTMFDFVYICYIQCDLFDCWCL